MSLKAPPSLPAELPLRVLLVTLTIGPPLNASRHIDAAAVACGRVGVEGAGGHVDGTGGVDTAAVVGRIAVDGRSQQRAATAQAAAVPAGCVVGDHTIDNLEATSIQAAAVPGRIVETEVSAFQAEVVAGT